ncbi:hypothetical protein [Caldisphaera lagunensis]|nr:hypothetical protein [Caldisphaera lagunensis]
MKSSTKEILLLFGFLLLIISMAINIFGLVNTPSVPTKTNPYDNRFDGIFLGMILINLSIMFGFYYKYEELTHEELSK